MNPQDWDRCKQIFCDALGLAAEEQMLLVDRECGGNGELREQVLKLLGGAADDSSPLDVGAAERVVGKLQVSEPLMAGDLVGRYRVLRRIGQGGTSLVYLAEHAGLNSPRRFAIKVIASAFLAGQHDRFDRECQILATFEHPNIARVIDTGVTESGWPYLVMDYIDGSPIHTYCIERKLAPPEIVRLMLDCCEAVKYIHSKFVLHCDLKPSNILVDPTGSPQILDFGISRLIEPGHNTRSGRTTRGIRPLTPDYASPEQLEGSKLTEATDIYSLGVVLYESLANTLPFDRSGYPWGQAGQHVADQDPAPPSKARLNVEPTRENALIARQLRGDLDSIVLKTLAYAPDQRYKSMDELSDDLNRYLDGEVVKARRSTWADRATKLVRRHRREMAEILALSFAIIFAVALSSWNARRQQNDSDTRHKDQLRAIVNKALREELPELSRARAKFTDQASYAIESVFPLVSQYPDLFPDMADALLRTAELLGNPYGVSLGRVEEARNYYHRAFDQVHGRTDARSAEIRARACLGLGDTYSHPTLSRDPAEAADWYERALTEISPWTAQFGYIAAIAHSRMGRLCELLGDAADARTHYDEALSLYPRDAEPQRPLDSALNLLRRAHIEAPQGRAVKYAAAAAALDGLLQDGLLQNGLLQNGLLQNGWLQTSPRSILVTHAAIEAHLALGLAKMEPALQPAPQSVPLPDAESEFITAASLAEQVLARDSEDLQQRQALAIALRRRAIIAAKDVDALRDLSTKALRLTMPAPEFTMANQRASSSCAESAERSSEESSVEALRAGDLLIANRSAGGVPGTLLAFSPGALKMSVLASGGYLSDVVDVALVSRTELYVVDRSFGGAVGIVRLRYHTGRWLQKPVTCGGLLRRPAALAYNDDELIVADADETSTRLIAVDRETGQQTLLGRTGTFTQPGKIVHSTANDYYLSLLWPGEGGPAEIVRFNSATGKFTSAARYGLLEDPVAIAVTPRGDLIAADREWAGNGGLGNILRISHGGRGRTGESKVVCRLPELSRVTALAVASEREAWYATAGVPYSSSPAASPKLFRLDMLTGNTAEVTISEGILTSPGALVRVE